jgi:hypothetical protein
MLAHAHKDIPDEIELVILPKHSEDELKDVALLPQSLDSAFDESIDEKKEPPLRYLHILDEKELIQLELSYPNMTRFDMDKKIDEHYYYFQIIKTENTIALFVPSILIPYFRYITGSQGIQAFFSKILNITVSLKIAHRISIPFVISSGICFFMLYSPTKKALKKTIDYAMHPPCFIRIQNALLHPLTLFQDMLQSIILNITNSLGGMSMLLFIWDDVHSLQNPLNWLLMISIVYFGKTFLENYYNNNFLEGLALFRNKKYPWLLKEMFHGNITLPIHVLLQSASAIFLRTYPLFYFITSKIADRLQLSEENKPIFISPVLAMITIQSTIMFYPSAIRTYFDIRIKLNEICQDVSARKILEETISKKTNAISLFTNEPLILISLLYLIFTGGILGRELLAKPFLSLIHESLVANILSSALGGTLLGVIYYRAEQNHFKNTLMLKASQPEEKDPETRRESCCEKVSQAASKVLNVLDNFGNMISIIGTAKIGIGFVSLLSFGRMLNTIQFNGKKYTDTIKSYFAKSPSLSTTRGTFFNRASSQHLEIGRLSRNPTSVVVDAPAPGRNHKI